MMRKNLLRALRYLLALLTLLLVLIAPVIFVIHSPAAPGWLSSQLQQRMAGVKINQIQGTLRNGIHINQLRIESGRTLVVLDDVHAQLRWRCLLWGTLCIDELQARRLLIDVRPDDVRDNEPNKKPVTTLPTLTTPVPLRWQQLVVDQLVFGSNEGAPHLDAIRCGGSWSGSKLFIDWGRLNYLQNQIELDGSIIFTDGYPVDVRTRLANAAAGINLSANVGGEVVQLNARLLLEQPVRAQGTAALSPLAPLLPYRGNLSLLTPYIWRPAEGTEVTIADHAIIELAGDKNIVSGEVRAQAKLPTLDQPAALTAPFHFDIAKSVLTTSPRLQAGNTQLDGKAILTLADGIILTADATARHLNPGLWLNGYDGDIDAATSVTLRWHDNALFEARGTLSVKGQLQQEPVSARFSGNWERQGGWKLDEGSADYGKAKVRTSANGQGSNASVRITATAPQAGALNLQCGIEGIAQPTLLANCRQLSWDAPSQWQIPRLHNQNNVKLAWTSDKKLLTLAPFCLRADAASLCSQNESRWNDGSFNARIKATALNLAWARYWLPVDYLLQGSLSGDADVVGNPGKAAQWSIRLATENAQATVPAGPQKTTIAIDKFNASIDSSDANIIAVASASAEQFGELDARLALTPDQQLDGKITLRQASLEALQPLLPQADIIKGLLHAEISIAGNRGAPLLQGMLQLEGGEVKTALAPWPVKNIDASLHFEDRKARLLASAMIGDDPVNVNGDFDWQQALRGKVHLSARELRITPLPRTDVWISPDLTATFQDNVIDIRGRIDVPRAYIIVKQLPKRGVGVSRDVVLVSNKPEKKSPFKVTGHIDIALGDAVSFRGFGLQTRIAGTLGLGFKNRQPTGNGRVQLVDGRYRAYGQMLDIRSGDLIFVGPLDNPVIRIEAIRSDVPSPNVVGVRANGELRNPDVALFSTPAMSERARLEYLLTGRAPDSDSEDSSGSMLGQALLAFGAGESEGAVAGVADKFGVHDVSLSTAEGETGTQVQLSAQLNSRLFLRYGKSVFDNANEVTMRYQLTKNLFVEAVSGLANALDLLWSLEFGRAEE